MTNDVRVVRIFFTASHREALYCQYQDIGASALTRLATGAGLMIGPLIKGIIVLNKR